MSDAHQQGESLIQHAREEFDREKRSALVALRTEVAELAVGAASKILGRAIDPQGQRDLLQEFIQDVGQA
jgi:F-type H+-transporting ATPase subunit b